MTPPNDPSNDRGALISAVAGARAAGRLDDALRTLDAIERAHPNSGPLHQERALCLLAKADTAGALASLERAVALNPALIASWTELERLLTATGAPDRAADAARRREQLQRLPPDIVAAGVLFCDGDDAEAQARLETHIAREGRHVEALRLLGRIAERRGALERAERLLREAAEMAPDYAATRLDLVRVLIARQTYAAALAEVEARIAAAPEDAQARFLCATSLAGLGRHDEAAPILRALLAQAPHQNHLRIVLGHCLQALGRTDEAVQAYRAATAGAVCVGDAYWSLANLKTYRFSAPEIAHMRRSEGRAPPGSPDRAQLCFALGKALEDGADYAGAWAHYTRGNALARAQARYRPQVVEAQARELVEAFDREFFAARDGAGATAADPIFVVGLPRSGSTLVEQILASHPEVDGTQELQELPRLVAEWRAEATGESLAERLRRADPAGFARLGSRYLDETRVYRRARPRFVDKMPNNFWRVGFIHLMLPNAKIIDMRRSPMAACVSNLKQYYARGHEFCYDVEHVARYYRTYAALMRHWDEALPGRVLRVDYEELVENFEPVVRRILDHCGLAFEPACLEFHRSRRSVSTPSSEQVRQPLYRDGLCAWRRFEPWLGPLRSALGADIAEPSQRLPLPLALPGSPA